MSGVVRRSREKGASATSETCGSDGMQTWQPQKLLPKQACGIVSRLPHQNTGPSPSGKANDFDSFIRWSESSRPSHMIPWSRGKAPGCNPGDNCSIQFGISMQYNAGRLRHLPRKLSVSVKNTHVGRHHCTAPFASLPERKRVRLESGSQVEKACECSNHSAGAKYAS